MNNVKRKNKIYYYLDCIFLLLPFILLFFYLCTLFIYKLDSYDFNTFQDMHNFIGVTFSNFTDWFLANFLDLSDTSTGLFRYLYDFIDNLFVWFGAEYNGDPFILYFIQCYIVYIVFYEFLSLFINIVLWIPRYIRSWVQEKGVNV